LEDRPGIGLGKAESVYQRDGGAKRLVVAARAGDGGGNSGRIGLSAAGGHMTDDGGRGGTFNVHAE